ncbi:MAG: gas vesicle protein GvpN [Acidobacteriia bacterium]|nr:gas vesicle protein GvpN [Terriglobia bacterium]
MADGMDMAVIQCLEDQVVPEAGADFVNTPFIESLTERALAYLDVGYGVHLAGPAGTGKTTLAFHIAAKRGRPVTLIQGDEEFVSSDLVGRNTGYHKSSLVDNYIHSVVKTEEAVNTFWMDSRLTRACQEGFTLIYDEFNRSRAEANNTLLSVLEERILNLPGRRTNGEGFIDVHPDFRAIFTSNPEEYAGVHKTQNALTDRLITLRWDLDRETEVLVTMAKSRASRRDSEVIVDIVRELRGLGVNNHRPTVRACLAIAKIIAYRGAHAIPEDPVFQWVCKDVLNIDTAKVTRNGQSLMSEKLKEVIQHVCAGAPRPEAGQVRK